MKEAVPYCLKRLLFTSSLKLRGEKCVIRHTFLTHLTKVIGICRTWAFDPKPDWKLKNIPGYSGR